MSDKILRVSNIDAMVNTIKTHVKSELNYTNEEIKNLAGEKVNELIADGTIQTQIADKSIDASTKIVDGTITKELLDDDIKLELTEVERLSSQLDNKATNFYKNKIGVHFGDSIIDIGTIPAKVASGLGATIYNVGFQGCCMTPTNSLGQGQDKFSMYEISQAIKNNDFTAQITLTNTTASIYKSKLNTLKTIDFSKVNFIIISYGTNDFGFNASVGDYNSSDFNTVCGALNTVLSTFALKYPNIEIIVTTPIFRVRNDINNFYNTAGFILTEYVEGIKKVCAYRSIKCIDLYTCSGINEYNASTFLKDGIHPTNNDTSSLKAGDTLIANAILGNIESGYIGNSNRCLTPKDSSMLNSNLAMDSENNEIHYPLNKTTYKNGYKYLTLLYDDAGYEDILFLHEKNIKIKFGSKLKFSGYFDSDLSDGVRLDILVRTKDTQTTIKTTMKNITVNGDTYADTEIIFDDINMLSSNAELLVYVKNMRSSNKIYARNVLITLEQPSGASGMVQDDVSFASHLTGNAVVTVNSKQYLTNSNTSRYYNLTVMPKTYVDLQPGDTVSFSGYFGSKNANGARLDIAIYDSSNNVLTSTLRNISNTDEAYYTIKMVVPSGLAYENTKLEVVVKNMIKDNNVYGRNFSIQKTMSNIRKGVCSFVSDGSQSIMSQNVQVEANNEVVLPIVTACSASVIANVSNETVNKGVFTIYITSKTGNIPSGTHNVNWICM